MSVATLSDFRKHQSQFLDQVHREPLYLLSRGRRTKAVVVSPDFYSRAIEALEDREDIAAAAAARSEDGVVSFDDLKAELNL